MAAKPKHKQASFKEHVAALKSAIVVSNPDDYLEMRPTWRVGMLELCPPHGWHVLSVRHATDVQQRLAAFETMTWGEILYSDARRPNHYIDVEVLSKETRDRLEVIAPDVDQLIELRIGKRERVFGIMDGAICQVLFWDPDHLVYPMNIADN